MSWKVENEGSTTWIVDGKRKVCRLGHRGNEKDARLLAAAPELLEALKSLLDFARFQHRVITDETPSSIPMDNAALAIFKAEGK